MASTSTKIGHGLAKCLGIKLNTISTAGSNSGGPMTRGESVFSVSSADTYVEEEPRSKDFIKEITPGVADVKAYATSLFPVLKWIGRYNMQWFLGDIIAGITIGAVVVPQGMAYASLAELDPQFGLYTSFMGPALYWLFATSKDINIGPVAVMSQLTGIVVLAGRQPGSGFATLPKDLTASALAVIAGAIVFAIGLLRLGFIVDFISATAVASFITGAAINIATGQVCNLLGIDTSIVNTHNPTYLVVINTLRNLPIATGADSAIGISALFALYLWRFVCNYLAKRYPAKARWFFFAATLRTVVVILFYTLCSWLDGMNFAGDGNYDDSHFVILGTVPRGFQSARVPVITTTMLSFFGSYLPATVIVLLIEHIAIAKSFGRINNYVINPSQELIAIGMTNLLGPFLGAYPATGSFSRTAITSKAGVRTPFAGVFTAIVVLLAIYALPAVFYWIPKAALAAVIIHAVGDLIMPPNTLYQFWRINPLEVFIFFIGVIVTVFSTIEDGIYTTVSISAALLLFRVAKARGRFLGKVQVHSVVGDHLMGDDERAPPYKETKTTEPNFSKASSEQDETSTGRTVFLPLNHMDGSNPSVNLEKPYPGIFIYRFSEGFNYPNANHYLEHMVQTIMSETRRTSPNSFARVGDRPWNEPGPRKGETDSVDYSVPTLKAVILDFSSVNNVDVTVVQNLIDVRNQLDRWAAPEPVEWHFTNIQNRWTKRGLTSAGFGFPTTRDASGDFHRWKPIYSVAEFGGNSSAAAAAEINYNNQEHRRQISGDIEAIPDIHPVNVKRETPADPRIAVVNGINRPFFHLDVYSALQAAITSVERKRNSGQIIAADRAPGKEEVNTVGDKPPFEQVRTASSSTS